VNPEQLGVGPPGKGGKAAATNNTSRESSFKSIITTGVMRIQALVFDDNGRRRLVQKEIPCNAVYMVATNAYQWHIPAAMQSRFSLYQYTTEKRKETNGLVGQMARTTHQPTADLLRRRVQRNQMLTAYIWWLIRVGILPRIEMSVVQMLLDSIFQRARFHNMNDSTECPRNAKRVLALVQSLVILDAIDKVFDLPAEQSPLHDKVFAPEHILEVGKHLVAKTEHLVFALGLEEHTYEDKILSHVLQFIRSDAMLDVSVERNRAKVANDQRVPMVKRLLHTETQLRYESDPEKRKDLEDELAILNVEIKRADTGVQADLRPYSECNTASVYDSATAQWLMLLPESDRMVTQHGFVASLAQRIHEGIHPKPQLEDIKAALYKLGKAPFLLLHSWPNPTIPPMPKGGLRIGWCIEQQCIWPVTCCLTWMHRETLSFTAFKRC
jgi:hypothetical protein